MAASGGVDEGRLLRALSQRASGDSARGYFKMDEEAQVKAMLEAMGVASVDETDIETGPPAEEYPPAGGAKVSPAEDAKYCAAQGLTKATAGGRDVSVAALVHLMGLPTVAQINLLESRIDMVLGKVNAIVQRVDRIGSQLQALDNQATLHRIDYQLSEIKGILKQRADQAGASLRPGAQAGRGNGEDDGEYQMLTSAPVAAKGARASAVAEGEGAEDSAGGPARNDVVIHESSEEDISFQQDEAQRIRDEVMKNYEG